MPELTAMNIGLMTIMLILGILGGWKLRGTRARQEKAAINAGWQEQVEAQRTEHDRLTDQSKGLMEQIGQYQASNRDAKNRARELSEAVREAFERRDELQREIKDVRNSLDVVASERDQLQSEIQAQQNDSDDAKGKDARIARLKKDLSQWQNRVPPLIESFRERNAEAEQLEANLAAAQQRIADLEMTRAHDDTHIEPVRNQDALTDGRDASNDLLDDDDVDDQIDEQQKIETRVQEIVAEAIVESVTPELTNTSPLLDDDSDDVVRDQLQQIKGIGPAIEKTLNEMGIFRFQQIAEMSEYEIDRVANRLKGFHSRIYREDWIGQAREFRDQDTRH